VTDSRLQSLLNRALSHGDSNDVALVAAQINAEAVAHYRERCLCPEGTNAGKPHVFQKTFKAGWPEKCACIHCGKHAPIEFCRKPLECCLAGRCCSEIACND